MLKLDWRSKSLRFWLTVGLSLAILPMAISAVVGHVLINRGVIASFSDVADRQRHQLNPLQHLRVLLLEALVPVDEFIDDGDPTQPPAYRLLRERIEAAFANLHGHLQRDPEPRTLVERARDDWTAADRLATEALAVRRPGGDPQGVALMQRFHGQIVSAVDKLAAAGRDLQLELDADHDRAALSYERSEWIVGISAVVSLIAMIAAVLSIGRIVSVSVDRLVIGAERFAAGDREHRIDVQVPPELHGVAQEFNRMIVRIHESEAVLADLAHRDGLTKLPNRRAFDDALREMFETRHRLGQTGALLIMDVDHFKRINDTYGHSTGDDVLRAIARTMSLDVRLTDRVFRIGGEEFAVLLPGANRGGAQTTAERFRQAVAAERIATARGEISMTVSIGMALLDGDSDPAALVARADAALYRAKREGRNRIIVCDSSLDAGADMDPISSGGADTDAEVPDTVAGTMPSRQ